MTRTVFAVRVLTKDMITDTFATWRSIIGGRVKSYEQVIAKALEGAYNELYKKYPNIKNVRFATTEMIKDGCEIIAYGEVTDEEYEKEKKRNKNKRGIDKVK